MWVYIYCVYIYGGLDIYVGIQYIYVCVGRGVCVCVYIYMDPGVAPHAAIRVPVKGLAAVAPSR